MALASAILKYEAEKKSAVTDALTAEGISIEATAPTGDLIIVVEAASLDALHAKCMQLTRLPGVLGVYPSYVTTEDAEGAEAASPDR